MGWLYHQASGCLEDAQGLIVGTGYAGKGKGKNNPALQDVRAGCRAQNGIWIPIEGLTPDDWGPLPRGHYDIQAPVDTGLHGPYVLWLLPWKENEMFGRSGFGIHGDSKEHPGLASEGCIEQMRTVREIVWTKIFSHTLSTDHILEIIE